MAENNPAAVGSENTVETGVTEATFTQADVDRIVASRLARATKDMPSNEELSAYRSWKATQQTEADKISEISKERDTAKADLEKANGKIAKLEQEKLLTSKGIAAEDVDYYRFKIGQMVTETKDFTACAEEFLKEKKANRAKVDMGGSLDGTAKKMTTNEQMNALIRGKFNS